MKMWQRRVGTGVMTLAVAAVVSWRMPLNAARPDVGQASGPVWSPVLSSVFYRPLTVFSRGGRVTAVAGVASDTNTYYMGSAGGVFKTIDAGVTWVPVTDGQINVGSIGAIAVADSDPNIVYVGTGTADPRGNVSNGDGVYKSTDAGKTWTHIGLEKAGIIGRIRINPTNPDLAFVAVDGNIFGPNVERGVYRTKDGGKTWEQVFKISENTGANDLTMDPKNPNVMIAAMWTVRRQPWTVDTGGKDDGLFKTIDGGDHWTKLAAGLPKARMGKIGVSMTASNPKKVYALIEADNNEGGVFVSADAGDTWTRVYERRNLLQRAYYYTHIFADPVDENTVFANNTSAFKSTDGGKTWGGQRAGHGDNHDWWINPKNNKAMIESNDGGANISLDGGQTWSTENNQPTAEIYRIAVDTRWPYWVYGAQQDNTSVAVPSSNIGTPDTGVGSGEAGYLAVDPRNYQIIYSGNYGGTLQRRDGVTGLNENIRVYADEETGQQAVDLKYRFQWNAPIRLSPSNPDIVYTTCQYVMRSKDHGQNWERISPDLTRNDKVKQASNGTAGITKDMTGVEVYDTIFSFEESPATAGVLWAGSDDGLLHISRDDGKTWTKITPTGLPEWATINSIDLSAKNAGHAIVTAYKYMMNDYTPYVFETNDYGVTWKRLADGKNGIPAGHATRVVREDPDMPGLLVAGTEYGMYISYDDGAHWQSFQLNLPRVPIMDLKFYRHNLIVATEGRSFWILDDVPVVEGAKAMPDAAAAYLFKPAEGYRTGGGGRGGGGGGGAAIPPPTFNYWFKDDPTSPVTLEVMDAAGKVVYTATGQPGTGSAAAAPSVVPDAAAVAAAGGRRGGGGGAAAAGAGAAAGGAGGRGGAGAAGAGAAGAAAAAQQAGGGGRGGGGRGAGGFGGAPVAVASAHKGLNVATWTQFGLPVPFQQPAGTVMWGGGGGQPRLPPGMYTVKVSMGSWSQTQPFHLAGDPRYQPPMSDADGAAALKMAYETGGWVKGLYDNLAKIRDAKTQAADLAAKTPALDAAAKAFIASAVKVEGDMTQLQGDPQAGQDGLSFSGRLDNQLLALYSNVVGAERKLGTAILERHADLKPQYDAMALRWTAVLTTDVATFNAAAVKAGAGPGITIK